MYLKVGHYLISMFFNKISCHCGLDILTDSDKTLYHIKGLITAQANNTAVLDQRKWAHEISKIIKQNFLSLLKTFFLAQISK